MKFKSIVCYAVAIAGIVAIALGVMVLRRKVLWNEVQNSYKNKDEAGLMYCVLTGDEKGLEKYLAEGVPVDFYEHTHSLTTLDIAIGKHNKKAVLMLLRHGTNIEFDGRNAGGMAVDVAAEKGDYWYLQTLLEHGANPNEIMDGAITSRSLRIVKILVNAGADLNRKDSFGNTYLISAVDSNSFDILYYLLENGVNPATSDAQLQSLLESINTSILNQPTQDDDYRDKVISWLQARKLWKDKEELWMEKHFPNQKK